MHPSRISSYASVRLLEFSLEVNFELARVVIFSGVGHITDVISATFLSAADFGDRTVLAFPAGFIGDVRFTSRISKY